jgi:DNA polymerase I-like protein with 3'-5' exonuclease and polymerase domains
MPIRPGISDEFLFAAGVEVLPQGQYSLRIPYRDWQGNLTSHNRWRFRNPLPDQKYYQPPDSGAHVYFSHLPFRPGERLYITEGEFKALAAQEAGLQAFGLPGLHCYTHEDPDIPPILLPGILEVVQSTGAKVLCFVGDADTLTNLEYYRSAGVLAQGLPLEVTVELLQIPLGGAKGLDDIRDQSNGEFPTWLGLQEKEAFQVDRKKSFLMAATLRLELRGDSIHQLPPAEREHHIERLVRMAAYARMSKEDTLAVERFCQVAQKLSKLPKDIFTRACEQAILKAKQAAGTEEEKNANEKIAYYDAIQPWPVERPLGDIIKEARENTRQFVVVDPRCILLTSCWASFTFTFQQSPYLPMLVFTGAEEDSGKSTYMKVTGRMSYRAYRLVATTTIHRVTPVYCGTYLLDECKTLADNKDLVSFLNEGFDNISKHPVDSSILPRYDMELKQLIEFNPRFPKMCAGIGTFLERDTLSRSLVINMERYLQSESVQIKEYCFCTDDVTSPVYRSFLTYWTEERQQAFGGICREVFLDFPKAIISRQRLKFIPILAVAKLSGLSIYEETLEAIRWFVDVPESSSPTLAHQLICDVARIFYRQALLHQMGAADPVTKQHSIIKKQPRTGACLLPTLQLLEFLRALPEAPWKCYGKERKILDAPGLYDFLRPYKIFVDNIKIAGGTHRGIVYADFCTRYERARRMGDPTLESVAAELAKDFNPPEDSSGSSSIPVSPVSPAGEGKPSVAPEQPDPISQKAPENAPEKSSPAKPENARNLCNLLDNSLNDSDLQVAPSFENSEEGCNLEVVDTEEVTQKVAEVAGISAFPAGTFWKLPPSTPAAAFCTAPPTLGLLALDIETFYPWPDQGEFPQPAALTKGQLRNRQKKQKAHPYAKDSRRCALRYLTVMMGDTVYTHDFLAEPELPEALKEALAHSTLLGHNLDFDCTVLRRYGVVLSSTWIDTMLASRLLGLGLERGSLDCIDENLDLVDEAGVFDPSLLEDPTDNSYGATVTRYLGLQLDKGQGDSDWALPSTPEQQRYIREDVLHLAALWKALESELLSANMRTCFMERMEFAPHLNSIKMAGNPINSQLCELDRQHSQEGLEEHKKRLQEVFSQLEFDVPPSRRKKVKPGKGTAGGVGITVEHRQVEPLNPNKSEHVVAALTSLGIIVGDAQKKTLARFDIPETKLFIAYSEAKSLLTTIKGILRNTFPDGRVRAGGWNQIAARTGRLHSTEPNLQNLPRKWRKAFVAPPGFVWLKSDLSQIEMVIIALHYQCVRLLELLGKDEDIYVHTAAEIFHKTPKRGEAEGEVSDLLRDVCKVLTLGISYVLGLRSFLKQVEDRTGIKYTHDQAREFYAEFFRMYPEIKQAHEQARIDALTVNTVYTVTSQRRFLPPLLEDQDPLTGYWPSLERRARIRVNTPIQGSCANVYIRALNKIFPRLPERVEIINCVHDEVDLLVPVGKEQEVKRIITEGFQEAFQELYGNQLPIQMKHYTGPNWAQGTLLKD